jgi:hypothetical protein
VSYEISVYGVGTRPESGADHFWSAKSNVFSRKPFTSSGPVNNLQSTGIHPQIDKTVGKSLYVSWIAPPNTGGWPVSKYKIEVNGASYFNTGQLFYLISDALTNGSSYDVIVTPITKNLQSSDANGDLTYQEIIGDFAVISNAIPMKIADALLVVSTGESDASISLEFAPGSSNGGAPLSSSNYECSLFDKSHVLLQKRNISPENTGLFANSFTGLTNGLLYTIELRVQNSVGFSPIVSTSLIPFKDLEFSSEPSVNGKTITFIVNANGRALTSYHVVAIDEDNINSVSEEIHVYKALTHQIYADTLIGSIRFDETLELSGDITKYLIIVNSSTGAVAFRSNFTT